MRFSLLGPVRAWSGEDEISLGSPQQRAVLALLLLRSGVTVSVDQLIDRLWGGAPPRTARQTLRTYVFRLRSVLSDPDGVSAIHTLGDGYVLRPEPTDLDLAVFRMYLGRAEHAGDEGDPERARDLLRAGLALWNGEAMSGLPGEYLRGQRASLARSRLDALEQVLGIEIQLGADTTVIGEASALVEENPLDERFRRLLMLALYRTGQQAQALTVYRDAQTVLADELGVDPGPLLQDLHLRILRAQRVTATGLPVDLTDRPDSHLSESEQPRRSGLIEPVRAEAFGSNQLPPDISGFAGRAEHLTRLDTWLIREDSTPGGVVCIHGMAGVGKTTLAVHWAHRVAEHFPDGLVYLNLRGFDPSPAAVGVDEALPALLEMLGVQQVPAGSASRSRLYRTMVTGRRMLLLLDNARDAEQVRALLPGVPGVLVLVTSRVQLTGLIVREQAESMRLDVLDEDEAGHMFMARIRASRPDVDARTVKQIVTFCGGLPLALTLVAAWGALSPALPLVPEQISDEGAALDALSDPDLTIDLRAVFSWSYRYLGAEAARLFRLMSVHPGPDLGVAAVTGLADRPLRVVRAALGELLVANVIQQVEPGRYAMHDLLRAYAGELCVAEDGGPARTEALRRMVQHYLNGARAAARPVYPSPVPVDASAVPLELIDDRAARRWVLRERRTVVAVTEQAARAGFDGEVWQLAASLSDDFVRQGHWLDQVRMQHAALQAGERLGDCRVQADAHRALGSGYARLRERQQAREHLEQAIRLHVELGDVAGRSRTLRIQSFLEAQFGEYEVARQSASRAYELAVECDDQIGQAGALNSCGWCQAQLGQHTEALENCRRAQELFQRLGVRDREACAWDSLGFIHAALHQPEASRDCYRRAVTLFHEVGDGFNEAEALVQLGDRYAESGDSEAAGEAWAEALRLFQAIGHPSAELVRSRLTFRPLSRQ